MQFRNANTMSKTMTDRPNENRHAGKWWRRCTHDWHDMTWHDMTWHDVLYTCTCTVQGFSTAITLVPVVFVTKTVVSYTFLSMMAEIGGSADKTFNFSREWVYDWGQISIEVKFLNWSDWRISYNTDWTVIIKLLNTDSDYKRLYTIWVFLYKQILSKLLQYCWKTANWKQFGHDWVHLRKLESLLFYDWWMILGLNYQEFMRNRNLIFFSLTQVVQIHQWEIFK